MCYSRRVTTIAQRELRNRSGAILRKAARGARFVVTVDGRPVAELGPIRRGEWVPRQELARVLRNAPVDDSLARDLHRQRHRIDASDPWARRGR